jgi:hypothetical protein
LLIAKYMRAVERHENVSYTDVWADAALKTNTSVTAALVQIERHRREHGC